MFFLWSIGSLLLILNSCICQQLCINSCNFNQDFDADLVRPSNCTIIEQERCSAILIFDYSTRIVNIQFGSYSKKQQRDDILYTSELISTTMITLENESSTKTKVEFYCSSSSLCEINYVITQALPVYIHKTCHHLRVNLISLLHSNPSSSSRSCMMNDDSVSKCDQPCKLFSPNPNQTLRGCESSSNLEFQTTIGRTTPTNKPEYDHRLYSYTCTTELCNGYEKQQEIEKLIKSDNGECLSFLEDINQTTTTTSYNQATSYSKSFYLPVIYFLHMKFFFIFSI
ncbi:unnamed protein product [Adineta steineri]|uniref:Uncharacterized protein n=1 Tax=Adineta steineri TaxID=433720 RepID=A0A814UZ74_9BILA|nr:unnamed protein product [Adineta steineri]CAF1184211.1 unnamed protein product [Adineta steineri]CAF3784415.1 unnamed protein product [Adineta steineri]CAF4094984.1 unnamed protein product [Adineta steineri]